MLQSMSLGIPKESLYIRTLFANILLLIINFAVGVVSTIEKCCRDDKFVIKFDQVLSFLVANCSLFS